MPIIAVILMLFSSRAQVNGPMFLVGWAVVLAVVSGIAYLAGDAASDTGAEDAVSWSKILFGAALLFLAARNWQHRPTPGPEPERLTWMAGIDAFSPGKALALGLLLEEN